LLSVTKIQIYKLKNMASAPIISNFLVGLNGEK